MTAKKKNEIQKVNDRTSEKKDHTGWLAESACPILCQRDSFETYAEVIALKRSYPAVSQI